jgi:hypothetical protein
MIDAIPNHEQEAAAIKKIRARLRVPASMSTIPFPPSRQGHFSRRRGIAYSPADKLAVRPHYFIIEIDRRISHSISWRLHITAPNQDVCVQRLG